MGAVPPFFFSSLPSKQTASFYLDSNILSQISNLSQKLNLSKSTITNLTLKHLLNITEQQIILEKYTQETNSIEKFLNIIHSPPNN